MIQLSTNYALACEPNELNFSAPGSRINWRAGSFTEAIICLAPRYNPNDVTQWNTALLVIADKIEAEAAHMAGEPQTAPMDDPTTKSRIMSISDAFATAYENLCRVIPKPPTVEEERKGARRPEIDPKAMQDAVRRFVDALSRDSAAAAELKRRGTLVATLTGEGSEYLTVEQSARKALAEWQPKDPYLQLLVSRFKSKGGRELVGGVSLDCQNLAQLLKGIPGEDPDAPRRLLEAWHDAASRMVYAGENDSLDGCCWLLHPENLDHEPFATGAAQDIRQAADAMVRWCETQAAKEGSDRLEWSKPIGYAILRKRWKSLKTPSRLVLSKVGRRSKERSGTRLPARLLARFK